MQLSTASSIGVASPTGARGVWIALGVIAFACAAAAAAGISSHNDSTNPLLFIVLTMGAATLLPWGPVPQALTVAIAAVSLLLNVLAVSGSLQAFGYSSAAAVVVALSVSVYIAQVLEHHRLRISQEINERRVAEDALRISEERYATAVRAGEVGVWDWDIKANTVHIDPVLKDRLGFQDHELANEMYSLIQRGHPDDRLLMAHAFGGHIEDPIPRFEFEHRLFHKDGSIRWFLLRGMMMRDAHGDIARVMGAETDITALKHAQHAQQEAAEVSTALVQAAQATIAALDTPALLEQLCLVITNVLGCQRSQTWMCDTALEAYVPVAQHGVPLDQWEFLRALRIPAELFAALVEAMHRHDVVVVSDQNRAQLLGTGLAEQLGVRHALVMPLRRGDSIVGLQSAEFADAAALERPVRLRIANGVAQLAALLLHHARLRDDLERANRLKSDFVATMSHELRTPLHAIIGYNDLVADGDFGPLTPDQQDALGHVRRSARHLREVIDGILDLSRLERGQLPLRVAQVDIPMLTQRINDDIAGTFDKPSVVFGWDLEPALPSLRTDPDKLGVVLKNIIANAIKFTAEGHVTVTVGADAQGVDFAVADTGIGIGPETLAFIFEPFRQAERYLTRRYDGLGLGLYVVRRLLDVLGGTLEVQSEVGRGSCFRVRIPHEPPAAVSLSS